jgi:hypothetical protein
MNKIKVAKGKFKSKGAGILKARELGPESMKEFLGDPAAKTTTEQSGAGIIVQNHKSANAQTHTPAKVKIHKIRANIKTEKTERLHVHIRKDLADKLLEMVFKRKCDRKMKKHQATQRVIIEEALEEYFSRHND